MRALLGITDAAAYLRLRERMLIDLAHAGKIPHRKIGKDLYFDRDELDVWWGAQPGHQIPAQFTDTASGRSRDETPPETTGRPPIRLTKGRRQRHQVDVPREQQR